MKWLRWLVFVILTVRFVSVSTAQTAPPYIYYFSDILHAFVIERADGSDSRLLGQDIIPEAHNTIDGPGWSPSGRWLAYSSNRTTNHNIGSRQYNVMSIDGESAIPFEKGQMFWSPISDLLLHIMVGDSMRVRLYDFDNPRKVFDQVIEGRTFCTLDSCPGIQWSPDGSQITFGTYTAESIFLYNLKIEDFSTEKRVLPRSDVYINQSTSELMVYMSPKDELKVHHRFTHQEWSFSLGEIEDNQSLTIRWNSQGTQAIIEKQKYLERGTDYIHVSDYFWISLESEVGQIIPVIENAEPYGTEELLWSPKGDKVILELTEELLILFAPSMHQNRIPISSYHHTWEGEDYILVAERIVRESGIRGIELARIDVDTVEKETLGLKNPDRFSFSPDGRYIQSSNVFYDATTFQAVARSRLSGDAMEGYPIWQEDTDWVLLSRMNLYPCCGYHSTHFEAINLQDASTRELTNCYGSACIGWLPPNAVARLAEFKSSPVIVPKPTRTLSVDGLFQRIAWSPDGTEIDVISTFGEDQPAKRTRWNVETGEMLEKTEIPYCTGAGCTLAWDIDFFMSFAGRTQLTNAAQTYRLTFDENARIYSVVDVRTNQILDSWDPINASWADERFSWVGDTLFIALNADLGVCWRYWHPFTALRTSAVPFICEFSPNRDYALLVPQMPTDRTVLLDVNTREEYPVNFYAHDGMFSPDGTQIVLGRKSIVTFWNVSDILRSAR